MNVKPSRLKEDFSYIVVMTSYLGIHSLVVINTLKDLCQTLPVNYDSSPVASKSSERRGRLASTILHVAAATSAP